MTRRTKARKGRWRLIGVIVLVAVGAAAGWWFTRPQVPAPAPTPAPQVREEPVQPVQVKTTGNYSQDWMDSCGPLAGQAQAACTARLDAAYGKSDAAPVPPKGR